VLGTGRSPARACAAVEPGEIAAAQSRAALEIALGLALPSAVAFAVLGGADCARAVRGAGAFGRGRYGGRGRPRRWRAICAGLPRACALKKVFGAVRPFAREDTPHADARRAGRIGRRDCRERSFCFRANGQVGGGGRPIAILRLGSAATLLGTILWRRGWLWPRPRSAAAAAVANQWAAAMLMGIAIFSA